jgi:hypothetical protein
MSEEQMDRFARGELSPEESRALARKALDNPELFDDLTYTAVARTELRNRARPRNARPIYALLATAAAIVAALSLYALRSRPAPSVALAERLVFLPHAADASAVFRGDEARSRAPRTTGAVTSVTGNVIAIDLGSLDGLAKGSEVAVVHNGKRIGVLDVSTIFRESARAEAPPGLAVQTNDEVRVPPAMFLRAALDQIAASVARGDSREARRLAEEAAAASAPDLDVAGYADLNNLGGVIALTGDKAKALSLYSRALDAKPPPDAREAIIRNLAGVQGPH